MRAVKSAEPPAPNGTTKVTACCGQLSCAWAAAAITSRTATANIFRMTDLLRVHAGDSNSLHPLRQSRLAGIGLGCSLYLSPLVGAMRWPLAYSAATWATGAGS